jgi:hypothetical protein
VVPYPEIVLDGTGFTLVGFGGLIWCVAFLGVATDGTGAVAPFGETLAVECMLTEDREEACYTGVHAF